VIVGLGLELVEIERFARAEARFGERLGARLFTDAERSAARALESRAGRFAVKAAALRALGLPPARWRDVEVVGGRGVAPALRLHGSAEARARDLGVRSSSVSLSHDAGACVGHVILENGA
jgi:holo-[acyl-carrier protein] synthase